MAKVLIFCFACLLFADDSPFRVKSLHDIKSLEAVRQQYEESCGAAAFATLLGIYGNKITEKEILQEANSTDMLSMVELAKIAKKYNLKAEGYKIDRTTFERLRLPIIARVEQQENLQHFIVVQNYDGQFIRTYDSNIGAFWIRKDEFYKDFEKAGSYILIVAPPKGFVNANDSLRPTIFYDGRVGF